MELQDLSRVLRRANAYPNPEEMYVNHDNLNHRNDDQQPRPDPQADVVVDPDPENYPPPTYPAAVRLQPLAGNGEHPQQPAENAVPPQNPNGHDLHWIYREMGVTFKARDRRMRDMFESSFALAEICALAVGSMLLLLLVIERGYHDAESEGLPYVGYPGF